MSTAETLLAVKKPITDLILQSTSDLINLNNFMSHSKAHWLAREMQLTCNNYCLQAIRHTGIRI